jgi:hypothetical protein
MSSVGFVNPPVTDLLAANLLFNRRNLTLISSLRGVLMDYLSYDIRSSSRINFQNFTALDGEIFIGIIDPLPKTDLKAVDAQPIVVSGELPVGVTDFNVGIPFETNKFPTQQVGAVVVYRNGVQQFRNPNNGTSGGNYQEVSSGGALGTLIKFNNAPVSNPDSILVLSIGLLAERPDGSMMAVIENLAGQIDAMVPTLATLAGVPESTFQTAPNNVDLKQFGDTVINHESRITILETAQLIRADFTPFPAQSIPSNVDSVPIDPTNIVSLYGMTYQAGSGYNPGTGTWAIEPGVIIQSPGHYRVSFLAGFLMPANTTSEIWAQISLKRNLTIINEKSGNRIGIANVPIPVIYSSVGSVLLTDCLPGDKIILSIFHSSGSSKLLNTESRYSYLTINKEGN